mgnify:CR=1 FL=1
MPNLQCAFTLVISLVLATSSIGVVWARTTSSWPDSQVELQDSDPVAALLERLNQVRVDRGLAPYDLSPRLTAAAQRHADDLAITHSESSTGSDGSTPEKRIADTGYTAWRRESGEMIIGESIWAGHGTAEDAIAFFLEHAAHRDNVLSAIYREVGIGVATDDSGRNYYVLDFGAHPNVLPIFVNEGAVSTEDPQIAIRLTNEEARPEGQGVIFMGRAIEIRISNEPSFDNLPWRPWEAFVPWTLPDVPGEHTVYVQFRDAAGRTAASPDTIFLGPGTPAVSPSLPPPSTPQLTPVTLTSTPAPGDTATEVLEPTVEPTLSGVVTPEPYLTAVAPGDASFTVTPFPTWTPLPTATPQKIADDLDSFPPVLAALRRTSLPLLASLQGMALLFGIYLALRRGRK